MVVVLAAPGAAAEPGAGDGMWEGMRGGVLALGIGHVKSECGVYASPTFLRNVPWEV